MRSSLSFLGSEIAQIPAPDTYGNVAVESVVFSRSQLEEENWKNVWENTEEATRLYGNGNVTFHFPVDNSDYIEDAFVRGRVIEGYQRAGSLGLAGFVIHSNRIRTVQDWRRFDQRAERRKVTDFLSTVRSTDDTLDTWLGLENMPLVGNSGLETDPLFSTAVDFSEIPANIGIVWDFCHSLGSRQYLDAYQQDLLHSSVMARFNVKDEDFDPSSLEGRIVHWHFAASQGLNNPNLRTQCKEGVLPAEADLPVLTYEKAMLKIFELTGFDKVVNFEVQEDDYAERVRGPAIIKWAEGLLKT